MNTFYIDNHSGMLKGHKKMINMDSNNSFDVLFIEDLLTLPSLFKTYAPILNTHIHTHTHKEMHLIVCALDCTITSGCGNN